MDRHGPPERLQRRRVSVTRATAAVLVCGSRTIALAALSAACASLSGLSGGSPDGAADAKAASAMDAVGARSGGPDGAADGSGRAVQAILFGGQQALNNGTGGFMELADTWSFDGKAWTQL